MLRNKAARSCSIALAALLLACCDSGRYAGEPNRAFNTATKAYQGRPAVTHPADNPLNVAKIDLGRKLFFDKRLSGDGTVACATCHDPDQGYTRTDRPVTPGAAGRVGRRNAQSLYDVGYRTTMFHDGRAGSLEQQYRSPMLGAVEMGNASIDDVVARLRGLPDYERFFAYALAAQPSADSIGKALAAYQRVLITGPNRFDRWRYGGETGALSAREIAGFRVFERANCGACHTIGATAAEFTDDQFRSNGYAKMRADAGASDTGRMEVTRRAADRFAFRTPTLRNVALTRPYMHDGRLATLNDVVAFYADVGLRSMPPGVRDDTAELGATERGDLVAFLQALNSATLP